MATYVHTSFDEPGGPPPGSPPTCKLLPSVGFLCRLIHSSVKYQGPWLSTQIILSSSIGVTAFLIFSYCRTRWPLLFAPRTKLKGTNFWVGHHGTNGHHVIPTGFSPHEAHVHGAFFGWILPTLRTSEYSVLQIVGLDAAVVCRFQAGYG